MTGINWFETCAFLSGMTAGGIFALGVLSNTPLTLHSIWGVLIVIGMMIGGGILSVKLAELIERMRCYDE